MASYIYNSPTLEFDGKVWHEFDNANIFTKEGEHLDGEIYQIKPSYLLLLNSNDDYRYIEYRNIAKMY